MQGRGWTGRAGGQVGVTAAGGWGWQGSGGTATVSTALCGTHIWTGDVGILGNKPSDPLRLALLCWFRCLKGSVIRINGGVVQH